MAKITITGDSFDEIQAVLDTVYSRAEAVEAVLAPQQAQQTYDPYVAAQQAQAAPAAPAEPPKQRRARKTAEAPAPVQPETAPEQPQAASPFAAGGTPFAPPPPAPAPDHTSNGSTERPAVTKLKVHLASLAAAHGEGQVYSWAIQNAFNLPVETTKDNFLMEKIYGFSDDRLEAAYRMSGGQ